MPSYTDAIKGAARARRESIWGPSGGGFDAQYQQSIANSTQQYEAVLAGYDNVIRQQQQAREAERAAQMQQFAALSQQVQGMLAGSDAAERQRIRDQYASAAGRAQQRLISAGLGNSTITESVLRGLLSDEAKAGVEVGSAFAGRKAQALQNIGLAGLDYSTQAGQAALGQIANLYNQKLGLQGDFARLYNQNAQEATRMALQRELETARIGASLHEPTPRPVYPYNPLQGRSPTGGGFPDTSTPQALSYEFPTLSGVAAGGDYDSPAQFVPSSRGGGGESSPSRPAGFNAFQAQLGDLGSTFAPLGQNLAGSFLSSLEGLGSLFGLGGGGGGFDAALLGAAAGIGGPLGGALAGGL